MSSSMPPLPNELSLYTLYVCLRSSPFVMFYYQNYHFYIYYLYYYYYYYSTCDSDFSISICHVIFIFTSKRVKQRNVGTSPCFDWTEIFPSFCQGCDLLAYDIHIDKPKAWYQQKRARSYVGFPTE